MRAGDHHQSSGTTRVEERGHAYGGQKVTSEVNYNDLEKNISYPPKKQHKLIKLTSVAGTSEVLHTPLVRKKSNSSNWSQD